MNLQILEELLDLWEEVYPHLGEFLVELYGRSRADFLEFGLFSGGVARVLGWRFPDVRVVVSGLEGELLDVVKPYLREEISRGRVLLRPSPLDEVPFLDESFDLVFVRGAFFFLNPGLLREVERVLAPGGLAVVGGGYGPSTPPEVIARIADRSRELNQALGRRWISPQELTKVAEAAGIRGWHVLEDGGLWLLIRKEGHERHPSLAEALGLERGEVVSLVGGGGKTTLMFSLARELGERGFRVITTTTTKIFKPHPWQSQRVILEDDEGKLLQRVEGALSEDRHVTVAAGELPSEGKLLGVGEGTVKRLAERADYVIVEADGSKGRPLKAPASHEPVVPGNTTTFVIVVGVEAIGKPLTGEWVFRPEIASSVTGLQQGEGLTPEAVAQLVLHPEGLMKGRPERAKVVLFINKVEERRGLQAARELSKAVRRRSSLKAISGRAFFHHAVVEVLNHR